MIGGRRPCQATHATAGVWPGFLLFLALFWAHSTQAAQSGAVTLVLLAVVPMRGMELGREYSSSAETRACCALCAVKEFIVIATLVIMAADVFDIYFNVVRLTGWEVLPFLGGNNTALHLTSIAELDWYDLIVALLDLVAVLLLSLAGQQ